MVDRYKDGIVINRLSESYSEKLYYKNRALHRLNGPARTVYDDSYTHRNLYYYWYYESEYIRCDTQEEFARLIKLRLLWK